MEIIFVRHGESTQNLAYKTNTEYDVNNVTLTKLGEEQAQKTGEYLKIYGKYDAIYSSPLTRALQTANIIKDELNFKNDIIVNNLLEEHNLGLVDRLQPKEANEYINKNKSISKQFEKEANEVNLFKKYKISKELNTQYFKYVKSTLDYEQQIQNVKKFLNFLKKQNHKRVLVVCHMGIIDVAISIVTNTNVYNDDLQIVLKSQTTRVKNPEPFIQDRNCSIAGFLLENNKYELIIPRNNMHLK